MTAKLANVRHLLRCFGFVGKYGAVIQAVLAGRGAGRGEAHFPNQRRRLRKKSVAD